MKTVETEIKYAGYLDQQRRSIEKLRKAEKRAIPAWFDYAAVSGLSREMKEKLARVRPQTLGQASRIAGVTPAAVSLIHVYIEIQSRARVASAAQQFVHTPRQSLRILWRKYLRVIVEVHIHIACSPSARRLRYKHDRHRTPPRRAPTQQRVQPSDRAPHRCSRWYKAPQIRAAGNRRSQRIHPSAAAIPPCRRKPAQRCIAAAT